VIENTELMQLLCMKIHSQIIWRVYVHIYWNTQNIEMKKQNIEMKKQNIEMKNQNIEMKNQNIGIHKKLK
jgi:hypothetical protein